MQVDFDGRWGVGCNRTICRLYLTLVRETLDLLYYPTQGIPEPFLRPEMVNKFAIMLAAVLEQLTDGSKCKYV